MSKPGNKYLTKHTAADLKEMVIMRGTGHSQKEIGEKLGMSPQKVSYHLKKLKKLSEENGVDETLTSIFVGAAAEEFEWQTDRGVAGLLLLDLLSQTEWWSNHYRANSHWLIQRLWQICHTESKEELDSLKGIVLASLPHYAESYGFNLEKWIKVQEERKAKK